MSMMDSYASIINASSLDVCVIMLCVLCCNLAYCVDVDALCDYSRAVILHEFDLGYVQVLCTYKTHICKLVQP